MPQTGGLWHVYSVWWQRKRAREVVLLTTRTSLADDQGEYTSLATDFLVSICTTVTLGGGFVLNSCHEDNRRLAIQKLCPYRPLLPRSLYTDLVPAPDKQNIPLDQATVVEKQGAGTQRFSCCFLTTPSCSRIAPRSNC